MLPNKLLFQDYCRRYGLRYLLFSLALLLPVTKISSEFQNENRDLPLSLGYLSIMFLYVNLSVKGYARVLLSLPLRTRDISITLWWLAVPLPALTVTLTVAFASLLSFGQFSLTVFNWIQFLILNLALNSIFFLWLRYGQSRAGSAWKDRLITGLLGTAPTVIFFLGMNSRTLLQNDWRTWNASTLLLLAAGAVCAVLSLQQSESLLRARARRLEGAGTHAPIVTTVPKEFMSGTSYLYLHKFREGIRAGMFNLIFFILYLHFASDHIPLSLIGNLQHKQEWFMILMLTAIGSVNVLMPGLEVFRHWRSLPMSTSQLALAYMKMTVANIAGLFFPLLVLLLLQNKWLQLLPLLWPGLVGLAAVCLLNVLAARCNRIALVALVAVSFAFASFVADLHLGWVQNKSLCLAIGATLVFLTYRIHLNTLRHGGRLYMAGTYQTQSGQ